MFSLHSLVPYLLPDVDFFGIAVIHYVVLEKVFLRQMIAGSGTESLNNFLSTKVFETLALCECRSIIRFGVAMIIWGFRSRNKVLGQASYVCQQCHQNSYHTFTRTQRWFTLFFIPIFPIRNNTISCCNMCGIQFRITKEQVEALLAASSLPDTIS
jgi:hypothetical protein